MTMCFAQETLTNSAVIKMHVAGLSDDLIASSIASQPGTYKTGTDDLIALKQAGLGDKVIRAMFLGNGGPCAASASNGASQSQTASSGAPNGAPPSGASGKPRIFLQATSKGGNLNSARDQSMEMGKDFERDYPQTRISLNQAMADYTVSLSHIEQGFLRDNQIQIANRDGDLISKTKEGGSIAGAVRKACTLILDDWSKK